MSVQRQLEALVAAGKLRDIDLHFARTLAELTGCGQPELLLAAVLVSRRTGQGHVCVELAPVAGGPLFPDEVAGPVAPAIETWREALCACTAVGVPGADKPLILDRQDRLYLGRYWHFESTIAQRLRTLAEAPVEMVDPVRLRARLDHYFPETDDGPDLQKVAAATALLNRLTVISGGPGTGKTTTVTRLLALLAEAAAPKVPRIVLAAPTGKAAARLTESVKQAQADLDCEAGVREAIAVEAATLHRLLGWIPGQSGFRHHAGNPLHLDVLVVDEASMVDVPLMARLLDALPEQARLILLGDKDQLASVEAGSVLGDICNRGGLPAGTGEFRARLATLGAESPPSGAGGAGPLADSLVVLTRSYRFGSESGIGRLARAVNAGNAEEAVRICGDPAFPDATWAEADSSWLPAMIAEEAVAAYATYLQTADPAGALECFGRFRFLCALRDGPFGVAEVNRAIEQALRRKRLLPGQGETHYAGRPVLVTRNDYALRLFNGDIGLILPDPEEGDRLRAFFPTPEGGLRRILPSRLPPHETVFAMTVHKSQGSEFGHCIVILPDAASPVVTRELVYTGITRAKAKVQLWGSAEQLPAIISRRVERASGLREALWGGLPER